jgi:AcrR family transcriptional regulator
MSEPARGKRSDATRNRQRILDAARTALVEAGGDVSMIEIARRAGLGSATLYRNFPSREALLEALLSDEVEDLCRSAATVGGDTASTRLDAWLRRLHRYVGRERPVALDLLAQEVVDPTGLIARTRARLAAAGGPLLDAARTEGAVRDSLGFDQVLDLVMAVAKVGGSPAYTEPVLEAALAGIRPSR